MVNLTGKHLVVVDMEPGYRESIKPGVLDAVEELVRRAVASDSLVVFLEFGAGPTYKRLMDRVRRYDCFVVEQKSQCDGSDKVLDACARGGWEPNSFVVCGVDTHVCVRDTVKALAEKLPSASVEVVQEGCGSVGGNDWDAFPKAANISLVNLA